MELRMINHFDRIIDYTCDTSKYSLVYPNMIYNRPDMQHGSEYKLYGIDEGSSFVFVSKTDKRATVHCWGSSLEYDQIEQIKEYIFSMNNKVCSIIFVCAVCDDELKYKLESQKNIGILAMKTNWKIEFDGNEKVQIGKKSLYNLRRSRRMLEEQVGELSFEHFSRRDTRDFCEAIEAYLKYKHETFGTDYRMSEIEYADKYFVTDCYVLRAVDPVAVLLTCQQCEYIYLENLTYNKKYSSFSPGILLYYECLTMLIKEGKYRGIILGTGDYSYKSRFGAVSDNVVTFSYYKSVFKKAENDLNVAIKNITIRLIGIIPRRIRVWCRGFLKKYMGVKEIGGVRL